MTPRSGRWPRALCIGFTVALMAAGASSCSENEPPPAEETAPHTAHIVARSGLAMGSELTLMAWTADEDAANRAYDAVFAEFNRLDEELSVWKANSDVVRINDAAGQRPVQVSKDTLDVLAAARQVSEWTNGKFDVTFGALSDIWKFDQDQDNSVPSSAAIRTRLPFIDFRKLVVDQRAGTAFLEKKGMHAHLGGIGKGFAVDRAVALMKSAGLKDFSIQSGGDLYVAGRRGDRPWRLGIADPRKPDGEVFSRVELSDSTFSTSGDYERFFISNGVRYHHILDPSTGQPSRLSRSVTIVAKQAVMADGLSTGVFLLGPDEGMALVERLPDVEAVIVSADNEVHVSSGLQGRVEIVHPPTDGL
jgi:FAD:protein FMN transferase